MTRRDAGRRVAPRARRRDDGVRRHHTVLREDTVPRPRRKPAGPGQESVWDYPRPPRLEPVTARIEIVLGGALIARCEQALRVLETSHPPTYYLPMAAFAEGALRPVPDGSFCEWKGRAAYFDVIGGGRTASRAAWTYPDPTPGFADLVGHVAVYPGAMDSCTLDGERVRPQPGGFYGGWITSRVVGPFKGDPGTRFW
jgi:uncharacterized protein (DUF427 family)